MRRKLYVIPYTFKSLNLSGDDAMKVARDIGFDGVEFGGVLTEEYLAKAESLGLGIVHSGLPYEEDGSVDEKYVELLKSKGINEVSMMSAEMARRMRGGMRGFGNMDDENYRFKGLPGTFGSYDMAMKAAESKRKEAEIAAKYGFRIYYHNHTHEFRVDHGEYVMDTYLKNTPDNIVMELDVGWALTAGVDVIDFIKKWKGRIGCLHVKACNWVIGPEALGMICPVPPLEEGITRDHQQANQAYAEWVQGPMERDICDWTKVFETAESVGCTTFIYERERIYIPGDIVASVKADFAYIRKCLDAMK